MPPRRATSGTFGGRVPHDYARPIQASLEAFQAARRSTAEILDQMTEAQWTRPGTHTESGKYSAEKWLQIYAQRAHAHADQIRKARVAV